MNPTVKKLVYRTPRILMLLFSAFISIFAMDVFDERPFGKMILALAMHLIPTALILVALLLAWRWEWVGGVLFTLFGILYLIIAWGKFPLSVYFAIAGPCFLAGILFLLSWIFRKEIRAPRAA